MYLSGSQIRRERTGHHAQSSKEGPSTRRKKKKKGALTVDRKKERLSDKMKKVPLDEIKLQGHLRRQPTVPRGMTSSLEESVPHIRKWRTQTLRDVNNRAKLRSHRIHMAEFDHREWGVRGSVG
jgi:hypothetical protein